MVIFSFDIVAFFYLLVKTKHLVAKPGQSGTSSKHAKEGTNWNQNLHLRQNNPSSLNRPEGKQNITFRKSTEKVKQRNSLKVKMHLNFKLQRKQWKQKLKTSKNYSILIPWHLIQDLQAAQGDPPGGNRQVPGMVRFFFSKEKTMKGTYQTHCEENKGWIG